MCAEMAELRDAHTKSDSETKKRLMNSALVLFSENGYEGTSIREIIARTGVTRPVLYYYFENKEDLFRRLVQAQFNEIYTYIDDVIATISGCRDRLRALVSHSFARTEHAPLGTALLVQVCFSPSQQGPQLEKDAFVQGRFHRITRVMRDGLASGELAGGTAETLAVAFSGMMDMHIMAKTYQPHATLTVELGYELVDLFMRGAANPRGSQPVVNSPFTFDAGGGRERG